MSYRQQWEYTSELFGDERLPVAMTQAMRYAQDLGADGWEMVNTAIDGTRTDHHGGAATKATYYHFVGCFMKRPFAP